MLREIEPVRQIPGEPRRRWFQDAEFDLIVWVDELGGIESFQLCYGKLKDEHAVLWSRDGGCSHLRVDDGENRPGRYKSSPTLHPAERLPSPALAPRLRDHAAAIDPALVSFVCRVLRDSGA